VQSNFQQSNLQLYKDKDEAKPKRFNKAFAVSFTDFLNDFRLDTALRLLDQTDMDIAQVAMESGFQSLRSFNSIFKTRIGKTPTSYRMPLKRLKNG
jgi:transcriptional regulator GlxA family with amidase domain